MKDLITLKDIENLEQRYPFSDLEMEILVRCHQKLREEDRASGDDSSMASTPSFLMVLAQASPYAHYFLPEDESGQNRLSFLENNVLPAGFSNKLRAAISDDAFVEYAHQHQDKSLERFLEGVADTGRRGSKQALTVLYKLADGGESPTAAFDIMDSCYRLALASEILETPSFDKEACLMKVKQLGPIVQDASEMMERHGGQDFTLSAFVSWAETHFPMLTAPLSTFVHHLLFHEHAYPGTRIEYQAPKLDKASDIFTEESSMIVTTLCLASASCNSKWMRLYSYRQDGANFGTLAYALLGYAGPTVLVTKTMGEGAVMGAMTHSTWKDKNHFYGTSESFLFQLGPAIHVHPPTGIESNFVYLHGSPRKSDCLASLESRVYGLGFGGCMEKPRLFIPEALVDCSAGIVDRTYAPGGMLSNDALEKFEIEDLEVWGVGGAAVIEQALVKREEHRQLQRIAELDAASVRDKSFVVSDFSSGLMESKLFKHREQARGRNEFSVDEQHGGYKLPH